MPLKLDGITVDVKWREFAAIRGTIETPEGHPFSDNYIVASIEFFNVGLPCDCSSCRARVIHFQKFGIDAVNEPWKDEDILGKFRDRHLF